MYNLIKPFLFSLSAEKAHHLTTSIFEFGLKLPTAKHWIKSWNHNDPKLERNFFGLHFQNPVGLAAGFDKDGSYINAMKNLGFGFLEIGTVTPLPQDGNPKPRLFRIPKDKGLVNRMGFNNQGLDALAQRLSNLKNRDQLIIGGNIGKNKATPNEEALFDYQKCFQKLEHLVDYFVVNVSSPNTPGLRELQEKKPLGKILHALQEINSTNKPILLKIAPDLNDNQLNDIVELAFENNLSGLIATNTTIERNLSISKSEIEKIGAGGLSGAPVREKSTQIIKKLVHFSEQKIPVIGVGGICTPDDALEKLDVGASLLQVYSGMVFYGPTLIRDINKAIVNRTNLH